MSEKEIIEVITYKLNMKNTDVYAPILYDEIQSLLNLYNKEKEKRQTLEKLLQGKLYEMYLYYKDLASTYQANCISKNKIREILDKYAMTEITEYDNVVKFYKEIKNLVEGDTNE